MYNVAARGDIDKGDQSDVNNTHMLQKWCLNRKLIGMEGRTWDCELCALRKDDRLAGL